MARPLRIEYEGAWYHVMNRGAGRRDIFVANHQRSYFLGLLGTLFERFGLETHAYCLLDNHYHLLLRTPEANLSRAIRHLDGVYTQYFNRTTHTDGPLFRGRYQALIIDADAYLIQVSRYIHRNPLAAGMVSAAADFPWSSYRAYLGLENGAPWLHQRAVLAMLNGQRERYRSVVERDGETDADAAIGSGTSVLGSDCFRAGVLARCARDDHEIPEMRRPSSAVPCAETIVSATAQALGVAPGELMRSQPGSANEARMMAMYLCQTIGRMRLDAIREHFGLGHYGSVASALHRYRRLRVLQPSLQSAEARVHRELQQEKT